MTQILTPTYSLEFERKEQERFIEELCRNPPELLEDTLCEEPEDLVARVKELSLCGLREGLEEYKRAEQMAGRTVYECDLGTLAYEGISTMKTAIKNKLLVDPIVVRSWREEGNYREGGCDNVGKVVAEEYYLSVRKTIRPQ
jgi:hypothetical protein